MLIVTCDGNDIKLSPGTARYTFCFSTISFFIVASRLGSIGMPANTRDKPSRHTTV